MRSASLARAECAPGVEETRGHMQAGWQVVYDADLKSYLNTNPLLRWFDALVPWPEGPARGTNDKLVRDADDLVILGYAFRWELGPGPAAVVISPAHGATVPTHRNDVSRLGGARSRRELARAGRTGSAEP